MIGPAGFQQAPKQSPAPPDRGWKVLANAPKSAHYFIEGRSLCGKWLNLSMEGFDDSNHHSPDNCKACMKKRDKLEEKERNVSTKK